MCSIIEAWGDSDFSNLTGRTTLPAANEASMNAVKSNQQALDDQRSMRQAADLKMIHNMSRYPEPDKVGQPVTWADNRRQYAQPETELNGNQGWNTAFSKPRPDMNSMTRGVHSRYSREKRIDARTTDLPFGGQITSDVDMSAPDISNRPGYLDLYGKPYEDRKYLPSATPTTTKAPAPGDAYPEAGIMTTTTTGYSKRKSPTQTTTSAGGASPVAANEVSEPFMQVFDDSFNDVSPGMLEEEIKSKFTQEVITRQDLVNEDRAARMEKALLSGSNQEIDKAVKDEMIMNMKNQLNSLVTKMTTLEQKVTHIENNKSHDIILFIVIAIFILFVLDNVFKLGRFS